ncbi:hypothetical protein SFR_7059 (plasmid) [Streptomyces sp. FR-008]|nr:hypothetical protein SFR_7059 [Streptomyces sp. FR-008]
MVNVVVLHIDTTLSTPRGPEAVGYLLLDRDRPVPASLARHGEVRHLAHGHLVREGEELHGSALDHLPGRRGSRGRARARLGPGRRGTAWSGRRPGCAVLLHRLELSDAAVLLRRGASVVVSASEDDELRAGLSSRSSPWGAAP